MDTLSALSHEPLDHSSHTPLYQQLKERILQLIATRVFDEATPLPNEQDIAQSLGLSRGTVRRCFQDLVDEGTVVRRRGQGTFVAWQKSVHTIETAFNFTAEISALGMTPSSHVLSLRRREARLGISKRLRVPDGTEVWEIRRIRLADERPLQYVTAFVPCSVCPTLRKEDLASSLYTLIAEASGKMPARAEEVYEAINLDATEACGLGVAPGAAALRILRTTLDQHGQPFETSVIVLRADHNRFLVTLDTSGTQFSKITM